MGKAKKTQTFRTCEFVVNPHAETMGFYAARLYEGSDGRPCGRPATVCQGGKFFCGRHDSELSPRDIRDLDRVADADDDDDAEPTPSGTTELYRRTVPLQRYHPPPDKPVRVRRTVPSGNCPLINFAERARQRQREREAEAQAVRARWRQANTRTCSVCGRPFVHPVGSTATCWVCASEQRRAERQRVEAEREAQRQRRWAEAFAPKEPKPTPPEPPSKPLQDVFHGKRRFLRED